MRALAAPIVASVVAALLAVVASGPATAQTHPARTVGFTLGAVVVIKRACGVGDDPNGIGRLLVGAGLSKADILPGGRFRREIEAGGVEARAALTAKLRREGRDRFCAFARARFGPGGLGVVRP